MAPKYMDEFRDAELTAPIVARLKRQSRKPVRLMEVCGTHTMAIFRSGIRSLLPPTIRLLSGPGCPVCVTAQSEIDAFIALAGIQDVIVTTFGDLMRVPGTGSSLQKERAQGSDIRMVYSCMDAVQIARENPDKNIVFLGVGFETTAPTIAASILLAREIGLKNYFVFCAHKRVPPALVALLESEQVAIDGFLLPGHVSVIIGADAYRPVVEHYRIPSVVAGFEAADILSAILMLVEQIESDAFRLENAYPRAVTPQGNRKAQEVLETVFESVPAEWRGIGTISDSGYQLREAFSVFDAREKFQLTLPESQPPAGCACGEILIGVKTPPECPLYRKHCTPIDPVGPCMVSSEGTCAAYYRYHGVHS